VIVLSVAVGGRQGFLGGMMGGGEECLQHGSKMCPRINGKRDEDHVFVIKLTNETVAMDERGGAGGGRVHPSQFTAFVTLKILVCIGSDCVENIFRVRGLGGRWWASDVDVCSDGCVGAEVGRSWVR
jgi:hypothetical protein